MIFKSRQLSTPILAGVILVITAQAVYCAGGPGSTSGQFLKLPSGARPIGMGETYVAVGDDVQSMTWNPAGLARIPQRQFTFMHAEWFEGIRYESLAYAQPFMKFITVGGGIDFLNSGSIDKTTFEDIAGILAGPENVAFESSGKFSVSNVVVTGSAAFDVSALRWVLVPNVQAGMNVRVVMEKIDQQSLANAVIDIGSMWSPDTIPNATFGFVAQNMGPPADGKIPPFSFRAGAAYKLFNKTMIVAADIYQPVDNYARLSTGMEYWYKGLVCVRTGYKFQGKMDLNEFGTGGLEGLTLGAGFRYMPVQVDYAFATLGFLGATHRVSLTVNF